MRDLILNRIEAIKNIEDGFNKSLFKWKTFVSGSQGIHISQLDFNTLDDKELLLLFQQIIRKHYQQF